MTEQPTDYTAKEGLMILIANFLEIQTRFEPFSDYDAMMKVERERHQERASSLEEPLKTIAILLFEVADQTHFVFQVMNWKIYYLALGLQHAVKSENPMSLANNARSLLEHIATISAIGQKIIKLESALDGQQSEKKILDALQSTQSYLRSVYYGESPKSASAGGVAGIHINDNLRDLKNEIANTDELYGYLCEFVHPNYGSNQLASTGQLASGNLKPSEDYNRELLDRLRRICSYCFIYLRDNVTGHLGAPLRIQVILELCFARGAKLGNVFAKKLAKPEGDGRSKETAYFFPKARNPMEAIKLTYEFLIAEGFQAAGPKRTGALEGGFVFDVHPTNKGNIWFKIPMIVLE